MSDRFQTASERMEASRQRMWSWVGGRAGRKEYVLWIVCIGVVSIGLSFTQFSGPGGGALGGALLVAQIRRLHDYNRTGWWAVAATVVPLFVMLPIAAIASSSIATLVGTVAGLVVAILIGMVRSDDGANSFGEPPNTTWKGVFAGR